MKNSVNQIRQREINYHAAGYRDHWLHCARGDVVYHARQIGYRDVADDACPLNQIDDGRLINRLCDSGKLRQRDELERLPFREAESSSSLNLSFVESHQRRPQQFRHVRRRVH